VAYNFLDSKTLGDALEQSEEYMKPFYDPLAELERITRGKPGKVPDGKPKITEGTLAGIRRETPKQIIQQLPTGKVVYKQDPTLGSLMSGTLTDIILPNANSGGTPYAKSKNAIKDTISTGASFAYCFFNRTGDLFHADFRRIYARDIYFEKGKVSEFDSNYMFMIGWYTESDLKAIIYWQKELKKSAEKRGEQFDSRWNLKTLQTLLDKGAQKKDDQNKSPEEKLAGDVAGYFKIAHALQTGIGGTFYSYAPTIEENVAEWTNPDPRGIIPLHGLVPEEDYANPLGEPLAAISAGKQNLLDFDLQMYQYGQGMQYSPTLQKWGDTPMHKVKIQPDHVIEMNGNPQTDMVKVLDINNQAVANFANNYGLLKSGILNETGRTASTDVSGASGNPGFSKTDRGVANLQARLSISDNDLRKSYELWFGRVCETMLNLHYAESQGEKVLELEPETIKRLKLPGDPKMDYSQEFAKIKFTIDASSSQAADNEKETATLDSLMERKTKLPNPDDKDMLMYNQIVKNSGVDDSEKLLYTEDEIQKAQVYTQQLRQLQMQAALSQAQAALNPQPQQPKLLGESVAWSPADLTPDERAQALKQVGIQADPNGAPQQIQAPTGPTPAELALKADAQAHTQALEQADLEHKHKLSEADLLLRADKQAHDSAISQHGAAVSAHPTPKPVPAGAAA
jgi:hypothetical protein